MSLSRRLLFVLRLALTLAASVWIAMFFIGHRAEIADAAARFDASVVGVAMTCVLVGLVPGALAWARLLARELPGLPTTHAVLVYLRSGIGKYTPGGVLAFAIQHRLLEAQNARIVLLVRVFAGTALAACLAAALVGLPAAVALIGAERLVWIGAGGLVGIGIGVALRWPDRWPVFADALAHIGVPPPLPFATTTFLMAGAWILTGTHLAVLGADSGAGAAFLISAYACSAIVGIVFAVLPGALGIRDGVLLFVLASRLDPADAIIFALASRVLIVAGDVIGTAAAALLLTRGRLAHEPERRAP